MADTDTAPVALPDSVIEQVAAIRRTGRATTPTRSTNTSVPDVPRLFFSSTGTSYAYPAEGCGLKPRSAPPAPAASTSTWRS
jgi:hypothetical protein